MSRLAWLLLACVAFAGASGCAEGARATHVTLESLPPKPPSAPIAVFFDTAPARRYAEVGTIRVESNGDLDAVLERASDEARTLGADAIVIELRYHYAPVPVHWDSRHQPYVESTPRLNANATAIVFDDGPPR